MPELTLSAAGLGDRPENPPLSTAPPEDSSTPHLHASTPPVTEPGNRQKSPPEASPPLERPLDHPPSSIKVCWFEPLPIGC